MPPKKKKTLKKGSSKKSVKSSSSKGGGGSGGDTGSNFIPPVLPDPEPEQFVTLDVKLITWEYLDFTMEVSLDCRLFAVMDAIVKKHGGSIASLTLYKDEVSVLVFLFFCFFFHVFIHRSFSRPHHHTYTHTYK
mmetsp:Transcript_42840/g.110468  ORF Transcript_42840/g.110468 Transcript_42840/m.110468 type:complete len:134 (+) Transcript_42840:314-715(+)